MLSRMKTNPHQRDVHDVLLLQDKETEAEETEAEATDKAKQVQDLFYRDMGLFHQHMCNAYIQHGIQRDCVLSYKTATLSMGWPMVLLFAGECPFVEHVYATKKKEEFVFAGPSQGTQSDMIQYERQGMVRQVVPRNGVYTADTICLGGDYFVQTAHHSTLGREDVYVHMCVVYVYAAFGMLACVAMDRLQQKQTQSCVEEGFQGNLGSLVDKEPLPLPEPTDNPLLHGLTNGLTVWVIPLQRVTCIYEVMPVCMLK